MKAGAKFTIEIGETRLEPLKDAKGISVSVTDFTINGEARKVQICPSYYADDNNIMKLIAEECIEFMNKE